MLFKTAIFLTAMTIVAAAPAPEPNLALAATTVKLSTTASPLTPTPSPVKATSTSTSTGAPESPTPTTCNVLLENNPWIVSKLQAFTAATGSGRRSFVKFQVQDTNKGLNTSTTCSRYLAKGATGSPADSNNYYSCDDTDLSFMYNGQNLAIERSYTDPCMGAWPWDMNTVWGQADTAMTKNKTAAGEMLSQVQMKVHITREWS